MIAYLKFEFFSIFHLLSPLQFYYIFSPPTFTTTTTTATTPLTTTTPKGWHNCMITGEGNAQNPAHCLAFYEHNNKSSGAGEQERLECCWTAIHTSELPPSLYGLVKVLENGMM